MNFERINKNYKTGLWTKEMVALSLEKGIITEGQYFEITGEYYNTGEEE